MLDEFQFDDRAAALYKSQQDLARRDTVKLSFNREQWALAEDNFAVLQGAD